MDDLLWLPTPDPRLPTQLRELESNQPLNVQSVASCR